MTFETMISKTMGTAAGQRCAVYLAAVSGGADSTAMLAGLAAVRKELDFSLHCAHVEHGIRPTEESLGDAGAVRELCGKLEIPCAVISIPPGKIAAFAHSSGAGIEAAARFFRYRALNRERRRLGADKILTGHTRDDALETLLMRVLRGSGPAGLAPMPYNRGRMLRPLLDLTRHDVLNYLEEKGIPYRTDSTNTDIKFLRNRVRHKLIPFLDEFFPSWRVSLPALAETQALVADFLQSETQKNLPWESYFTPDKRPVLQLREDVFLKAPPIIREEAVFAGTDLLADLDSGGKSRKYGRTPRRSAVRRAVIHTSAGDLGPVRLEKQNGYIKLKPVRRFRGEKGFSLLIKETGLYTLKGKVRRAFNGADRDLTIHAGAVSPIENHDRNAKFSFGGFFAKFPLVFRNHEKGDCILKGGHNRRFSDIMDSNVHSRYSRIITVCDTEGTAAFIAVGPDLLVIGRDDIKAEAGGKYFFLVS